MEQPEIKRSTQGSQSYLTALKSRPSATWSPQSKPTSSHVLQRKPSLKLVPLIGRFEALNKANLDALAAQELQPAPLQLFRKKTRVNGDHQQHLSTIFSPDISRDNDDVFNDEKDNVNKTSSHGDDEEAPPHYQVANKGVITRGRSIDVKRSVDIERTKSKSIKDRIMFFDRGPPPPEKSEQSLVRVPSKFFQVKGPLGTPPLHKETKPGTPESSYHRSRPVSILPITPTRSSPVSQAPKSSHKREKPVGTVPGTPKFSPSSQSTIIRQLKTPFGLSSPLLQTPSKLKSNNTPSPPKVKLSDVYTDNSHLPARGRAILRKNTLPSNSSPEKSWSPPESPAQTMSPFKDHCRGQIDIPSSPNHRPFHSRRRNLSDKVEALYRERRKKSPLRINNTDGKISRKSSWGGALHETNKPVGKLGSKIASLRKLFDGSISSDSDHDHHLGFLKKSKTTDSRSTAPYVQNDSQRALKNASFSRVPTPEPKSDSPLERVSSLAHSKTYPTISSSKEKHHGLKNKIGDKIKLFESIARGKEKIERQFRTSNSNGTVRRLGNPFISKRGRIYSSLKDNDDMSSADVDGEAIASVDRYDGKKEREGRGTGRFKVGSWKKIPDKEKEGKKEGRSSTTAEDLDLIIKEAECGLRQPKPLRLAEMKRMKALCKGFQERLNASKEKEKEKGSVGEKDREKNRDGLRIIVPV